MWPQCPNSVFYYKQSKPNNLIDNKRYLLSFVLFIYVCVIYLPLFTSSTVYIDCISLSSFSHCKRIYSGFFLSFSLIQLVYHMHLLLVKCTLRSFLCTLVTSTISSTYHLLKNISLNIKVCAVPYLCTRIVYVCICLMPYCHLKSQ